MLRFCPGDFPLRAATGFSFSEGGGEYNVARAMSRCFGHQSGVLTALVDNEIGHLVAQLVKSSGVSMDAVVWREFDGIGRECRNPLYFAERGFGVRGAKATMDRGHSAPSQMRPGDVDWDHHFGDGKCRWFHTGGIFVGLSESAAALALEGVRAARRHGIPTSYDLNFRPSLWQKRGGAEAARLANRQMVAECQHLIGIEPLWRGSKPPVAVDEVAQGMEELVEEFPNLESVAVGRRIIHSSSCHEFGGSLWRRGRSVKHFPGFGRIEVLDRIGSGDGFAAGVLAALIEGLGAEQALRRGCACAALTMSTPGDAVLVSRQEVDALASSGKIGESR